MTYYDVTNLIKYMIEVGALQDGDGIERILRQELVENTSPYLIALGKMSISIQILNKPVMRLKPFEEILKKGNKYRFFFGITKSFNEVSANEANVLYNGYCKTNGASEEARYPISIKYYGKENQKTN